MDYLIDSNVLTYLANPVSPFYAASASATAKLGDQSDRLFIVPQNLIEFWVSATRPTDANGLGLSVLEARAEVQKIKDLFFLLDETPEIFREWEHLVLTHRIIGKSVHDARLVAQMNVHGIANILTFNVRDFTRFGNINTIEPESV
ncbi:MAG: PIN domain-containing protein [Pyrinomonadaceae bacterium]|nr:PIN domain-containing protein [Pyrinomonadaceae bacterium]